MCPGNDETTERLTPLKVFLLVEATAMLIALAVTFGPSKTGSTFSFADLVWDEPSAVQRLSAGFVATNVLLAVLAGIGYLAVKRSSRRDSRRR
jgi:hypothetical protein